MSSKDRLVACSIAKAKDNKVESIREVAKMASEEFSVYRNRLLKKGVVFSPGYGTLEFMLPRFKEYVNEVYS